jgi:tetratricopeptide (TPR) repeat protein
VVALGRLERLRGDYEAAEAHLTEARTLYASSLPPDHPAQAGPLRELGYVRVVTGAFEEAEPLLRQALAILGQDPYANPYYRAELQWLLGSTLTHLGRYEEAEPYLRASLNLAEERELPAQAARARDALADLAAARDRPR